MLYRILVYLLVPLVLLSLLFKGLRNRAYWWRWSERFGLVPLSVRQAAPYDLWLHAVSVGEVRAAAPLVKQLIDQLNYRVLVTTTTPTGSDMVSMMLGDQVKHCYLPYDLGYPMRHFIRTIQPKLSLVMETEIWPNLIRSVKQIDATLLYTNVRLSERSYRRYAKLKSFITPLLAQVDHFAVQGAVDAKHLVLLGVDQSKISQTGSIKFDVTMPPSLKESAEVLRRQLGQDRLIWIAGSTREGEEALLLKTYKKLKKDFASLLLIIVPRHPERFDLIARKIQRMGLHGVRRTDNIAELNSDVDVYLGDTMGELALMYASSDVAFVGGSLVPLGGQNILEPCALGVPVLFGPYMFNFTDISQWTMQEGAGLMVQSTDDLVEQLGELLADPDQRDEMGRQGLAFIEKHRGALDKNLVLIKALSV